jgi:hypothetical protein
MNHAARRRICCARMRRMDFISSCARQAASAVMRMVAIAEAAGRPYLIGQMDEGMLATAAAMQCGLCANAISYELWGYQRVATQPFEGLVLKAGI